MKKRTIALITMALTVILSIISALMLFTDLAKSFFRYAKDFKRIFFSISVQQQTQHFRFNIFHNHRRYYFAVKTKSNLHGVM